jgi:hypothetical protein
LHELQVQIKEAAASTILVVSQQRERLIKEINDMCARALTDLKIQAEFKQEEVR